MYQSRKIKNYTLAEQQFCQLRYYFLRETADDGYCSLLFRHFKQ